jgi:hypothetical protein
MGEIDRMAGFHYSRYPFSAFRSDPDDGALAVYYPKTIWLYDKLVENRWGGQNFKLIDLSLDKRSSFSHLDINVSEKVSCKSPRVSIADSISVQVLPRRLEW